MNYLNKDNDGEKPELIAQIMEREKENLFRYGFYHLGSKSDTEDIMQDLFLNLCKKAKSLPHNESELKCYIIRSMQNACCDCLRRKNKSHSITHLPLEKVLNSAKEIPAEEITHTKQAEEFLRINRLLSTLPQKQSETLRLRIYSECTFSEIAEIMQVPVTTAKSRFKYGIEKLRENLALDNFLTF